MISVLVVDDHPVIRMGIARLLASTDDMLVLGTASTGEAAVVMAAELRPDVVLMDIELPNLNGIEATRVIVSHRPETAVVMLTTYDDRDRVHEAVEAGASGFLSKSIAPEALIACVRVAPHDWVSYVSGGTMPVRREVTMAPIAPLGMQAARRLRARDERRTTD